MKFWLVDGNILEVRTKITFSVVVGFFVGIWWEENVGQGKCKWCGTRGLEWMIYGAKKLMERINGVKF